jgi:hypothetical protein
MDFAFNWGKLPKTVAVSRQVKAAVFWCVQVFNKFRG